MTILLLGQTGQVGHELLTALAPLGNLVAPDRNQFDLTNADSMRDSILRSKPDVIVNAAGFTIVDAAERHPELAMQVNGIAPGIIAECAKRAGALLIHYSTTFVFDGAKGEPYLETDTPNPINAYGRSKLAGEQAIRASGVDHLILRANWTYSSRRSNFVLAMLQLARSKTEVRVVDDQVGTPTWARIYAQANATMLRNLGRLRDNCGTYNFSAAGQCTRYQWAELLLALAKARAPGEWAKLTRTTNHEFANPAPRPLYTVTNSQKIRGALGIELEAWDVSTRKFFQELNLD